MLGFNCLPGEPRIAESGKPANIFRHMFGKPQTVVETPTPKNDKKLDIKSKISKITEKPVEEIKDSGSTGETGN